jgi:diguanylate cyclase (GGDEF)-like protein
VLTAWWDDAPAREQSAQLQRALAQIAQQQAAFDKLDARYRDGQDRPSPLFRSENFEEHLRRELALSSREHREFALAVLVLEDAPAMAATHGPGCVARVSDAIVQMLRANTRTMDMISPLGGGRFGVLLSGVGLSTAYSRLDQFRRQCRTHLVVHEGVSVQFQVSAGVASFPHSAETLDALSEAAEAALAEAARQGGHRVCVAALPLPAGAPAWRLPSAV